MNREIRPLDITFSTASSKAAKQLYDRLCLITHIGGICTKLINNTGVPSVRGTLVKACLAKDRCFILTPPISDEVLGVVYDDGVQPGDECRIVIAGVAELLLKDGTGSIRGNRAEVSDIPGRALAIGLHPNPNNSLIEVGHILENKAPGINVLALCFMQYC